MTIYPTSGSCILGNGIRVLHHRRYRVQGLIQTDQDFNLIRFQKASSYQRSFHYFSCTGVHMNETGTAGDRHMPDPETWVDRYGDYLYRFALSFTV